MVLGRKTQVFNTVNQKNNARLIKQRELISKFIAKKLLLEIVSKRNIGNRTSSQTRSANHHAEL